MPALSLKDTGDTINTESLMSKKTLYYSRQSAYIAQAGACFYCGCAMWLRSSTELTQPYGITEKQAKLLQCTAEHLIPQSEGGCDLPANIVAACLHCNSTRHRRKSPLKPDKYLAMVRSRVAKRSWYLSAIVSTMYDHPSGTH